VFAGQATYLVNRAQADDLAGRGAGYLDMFRGLGDQVARELDGVTLGAPDVVYDRSCDLDLGGRVVHLRPTGQGHTKGDQVVTVPYAGVIFTGDLVETGQFSIFPWFPPYDTDVTGLGWIAVMDRLSEENPRIVVPGHGDIGGRQLLVGVRDYLTELRDETWRRRDAAMDEQTTAKEVRALSFGSTARPGGIRARCGPQGRPGTRRPVGWLPSRHARWDRFRRAAGITGGQPGRPPAGSRGRPAGRRPGARPRCGRRAARAC
jgi:glyoxylase-like metal-dependent hydrolase (beta-lactamase superfamily II)